VRQVCLASELSNPRHAVLLDSGQFVVSLKDSICLVGADGRRILANKKSTPGASVSTSASSPEKILRPVVTFKLQHLILLLSVISLKLFKVCCN